MYYFQDSFICKVSYDLSPSVRHCFQGISAGKCCGKVYKGKQTSSALSSSPSTVNHRIRYEICFAVMLFFLVLLSFFIITVRGHSSHCRCIPGDSCWLSLSEWAELNSTVHGRLIATVSLAKVCHSPYYDSVACLALRAKWGVAGTQYILYS